MSYDINNLVVLIFTSDRGELQLVPHDHPFAKRYVVIDAEAGTWKNLYRDGGRVAKVEDAREIEINSGRMYHGGEGVCDVYDLSNIRHMNSILYLACHYASSKHPAYD